MFGFGKKQTPAGPTNIPAKTLETNADPTTNTYRNLQPRETERMENCCCGRRKPAGQPCPLCRTATNPPPAVRAAVPTPPPEETPQSGEIPPASTEPQT